jgi:hypothetical protein
MQLPALFKAYPNRQVRHLLVFVCRQVKQLFVVLQPWHTPLERKEFG